MPSSHGVGNVGRWATRVGLQSSLFKMWNLHGIESEVLDYKSMRVLAPLSMRREIVEFAYYLPLEAP